MKLTRFCTLGLLAVALGLLLPVPREYRPAQASAAGQTQTQERVILRINRNLEVPGYIALEDDDIITIRTLRGQIESHSKSRILQIVRLVNPAEEQTGVVFMRDGQTREGIIVEDAFEHVLVEIHGIRAKLKRATVSHVVLQPTPDQRYAEYKANLQPGMYDAHLALCRWLVEQRRYALAHQELEELLEQTDMPEARRLMTLVQAQLALGERPIRTTPTAAPTGAETTGSAEGLGFKLPERILTKEEVNLIRVYQMDLAAGRAPKVTITPDTVRAIIENYGTSKLVPASQTERNAMFRAAAHQPLQIVKLMFDLRARDLYPQIQVNTEPYALNLFRERVHDTWLMNNCATSKCHGGEDAVSLFLHRKNYKDERVRYTNLMILERLQLNPEWPLINFEQPEDSLIIQYALSREHPRSRKPHPRVPGYVNGVINKTNERLLHDAVEWIRAMIPRAEYPIEYEPPIPPGGGPALAGSESPSR